MQDLLPASWPTCYVGCGLDAMIVWRRGMASSMQAEMGDIRVRNVALTKHELSVALIDGRTITDPLAWFPRLANATPEQRAHWEIAGAGQGIHWPEIDEDLRAADLLCGIRAPRGSEAWRSSSLAT